MDWIFDGIGTEIISAVVGLIVGGISGYKIGLRKTGKQKQIAGDNARQTQKIFVESDKVETNGKSTIKRNTNVRQYQEAGNNSEQVQIGEIHNEHK